MSFEEIRNERIKKLKLLKEKVGDIYPVSSHRDFDLKRAIEDFDELVKSNKDIWLAGRVMALRPQGAIIFFHLYDGTAKFQIMLKKEEVSESDFDLFSRGVDVGDFVEVKGKLALSKRGEKSLIALKWGILSKSLRPLPDKWHGLKDQEERYRKRYLDILLNEDIHSVLKRKALFWRSVRNFLEGHGFLEVETPSLELTTGGAEANPFKTHHDDFDLEVYLRISVGELWQKRLMAAGLPKTFEIGRVFRNEGTSAEHLQEFTNAEFYAAYMNFSDGQSLVVDLYRTIAKEVYGKSKFSTRGHTFDLDDDWTELDYVSVVEEITGVNVLEADEKLLKEKLRELKVDFVGDNRERLIDSLWKHCRKKISGPAFLINHPKIVAPLSKAHPDDDRLTKTFQVIIAGSELGRAHGELNDPLDQRERFEIQNELIKAGDKEAMMPDWDFVEMLEYGMPPTFGFGFGERLFAFLEDKSLRDVQLFPLMRPKNHE